MNKGHNYDRQHLLLLLPVDDNLASIDLRETAVGSTLVIRIWHVV